MTIAPLMGKNAHPSGESQITKEKWNQLPTNNRSNGPMPKYLQIRQLIGQDLYALESLRKVCLCEKL